MDCNTYPTYSHGQVKDRAGNQNLSEESETWATGPPSIEVKTNLDFWMWKSRNYTSLCTDSWIHESITVMKIWIPRQRDGFKMPSCLCDQSTEQQPLSCSAHRSVRIITLRLCSCCVTIGDSFLSAKQTAIHSCLDGSNNSTSMSAVMHVITTHFTNLDWLSMSNQSSSNSFGI